MLSFRGHKLAFFHKGVGRPSRACGLSSGGGLGIYLLLGVFLLALAAVAWWVPLAAEVQQRSHGSVARIASYCRPILMLALIFLVLTMLMQGMFGHSVLINGCRLEEEAVIKDVDLEAPCTLQRPGRPRWLGSHEGA